MTFFPYPGIASTIETPFDYTITSISGTANAGLATADGTQVTLVTVAQVEITDTLATATFATQSPNPSVLTQYSAAEIATAVSTIQVPTIGTVVNAGLATATANGSPESSRIIAAAILATADGTQVTVGNTGPELVVASPTVATATGTASNVSFSGSATALAGLASAICYPMAQAGLATADATQATVGIPSLSIFGSGLATADGTQATVGNPVPDVAGTGLPTATGTAWSLVAPVKATPPAATAQGSVGNALIGTTTAPASLAAATGTAFASTGQATNQAQLATADGTQVTVPSPVTFAEAGCATATASGIAPQAIANETVFVQLV